MDAHASLSPKGDPKPEYPSDFETCWKAYPHVKGRSSKPKSLGYWKRISAPRRAMLPAAIERYAREGREPNEDCGAPAMERWLRDQRFLEWLEAPQTVQHPAWAGPEDVRAAIASGLDDPSYTDTYLRYCSWRDVPERALVTDSETIFAKLKPCAARLEKLGVRLRLEKGRAA